MALDIQANIEGLLFIYDALIFIDIEARIEGVCENILIRVEDLDTDGPIE